MTSNMQSSDKNIENIINCQQHNALYIGQPKQDIQNWVGVHDAKRIQILVTHQFPNEYIHNVYQYTEKRTQLTYNETMKHLISYIKRFDLDSLSEIYYNIFNKNVKFRNQKQPESKPHNDTSCR